MLTARKVMLSLSIINKNNTNFYRIYLILFSPVTLITIILLQLIFLSAGVETEHDGVKPLILCIFDVLSKHVSPDEELIRAAYSIGDEFSVIFFEAVVMVPGLIIYITESRSGYNKFQLVREKKSGFAASNFAVIVLSELIIAAVSLLVYDLLISLIFPDWKAYIGTCLRTDLMLLLTIMISGLFQMILADLTSNIFAVSSIFIAVNYSCFSYSIQLTMDPEVMGNPLIYLLDDNTACINILSQDKHLAAACALIVLIKLVLFSAVEAIILKIKYKRVM